MYNCYVLQKQHCHTIIHINVHYSTNMENSNLYRYRLTLVFLQQLLLILLTQTSHRFLSQKEDINNKNKKGKKGQRVRGLLVTIIDLSSNVCFPVCVSLNYNYKHTSQVSRKSISSRCLGLSFLEQGE